MPAQNNADEKANISLHVGGRRFAMLKVMSAIVLALVLMLAPRGVMNSIAVAGSSDESVSTSSSVHGTGLRLHVDLDAGHEIIDDATAGSMPVLRIVLENHRVSQQFREGLVDLELQPASTSSSTATSSVKRLQTLIPPIDPGHGYVARVRVPADVVDPAHAPISFRVRIHETENRTDGHDAARAAADGDATAFDIVAELVADVSGTLVYGPLWRLAGPYGQRGRDNGGFAQAFGPELDAGLTAWEPALPDSRIGYTFAVESDSGPGDIQWRPLPQNIIRDADGYHDFRQLFGERNNVTIYAATTLISDAEREVMLQLGSDDALQVWVNGEQVHQNNVLRGSGPGQDQVKVSLQQGANEVLLKIVQWGGWYGFHFDVTDVTGEELPDAAVRVPESWMLDRPATPELTIVEMDERGPVLEWTSDTPTPTSVVVQPATHARFDPSPGLNDSDAMLVAEPQSLPVRFVGSPVLRTQHRIALRDLNPGTRYIAFAESVKGDAPSGRMTFTTPAADGEMQFLRLRLVNLIFTNVTETEHADREGADYPMPDDQVERIIDEINENVIFYWVNSGMKVWLDMVNLRYDEPLTIESGTKYGYSFNNGLEYEVLNRVLADRGESGSDYDGVNFISVDKHFENGGWKYRNSGGGTLGPLPPYNIGKSGWKGACDHAWLFCHEFGHQLDALYA
ncbi:MAG: hypothetical protein ACOC0P_03875, partial [Planctomycetota bacterium]